MEGKLNLLQKLVEIRKQVQYLKKDKNNKGQNYNYVSMTSILTSIRNEMDKQGVLLKTDIDHSTLKLDTIKSVNNYGKEVTQYMATARVLFTWLNSDDKDDTLTTEWSTSAVNTDPAKAIGSMLSYGERYFILKALSIANDEFEKLDPDSEHYSKDNGYNVEPKVEAKKEPLNTDNGRVNYDLLSTEQKKMIMVLMKEKGIGEEYKNKLVELTGKDSLRLLTKGEASKVIENLKSI